MQRRLKGKDFADAYGLVGGLGSSLEICKGYELREGWGKELPWEKEKLLFYVEPRYEREDRDAWKYYDPLEEYPDLFLEFARLAEKDRSNPNEIALEWAHRYGLLGTSRGYYQDRHTFRGIEAAPHEYVHHFFEEVDRAAAILAFYEASLNRNENAIIPLLQRFPTWPVELFVRYVDSDATDLYGGKLGFALYLVTYEVVRTVHAFAFPKLTLQPGSSLPSSLSSGYGFFNPLGAMYLQMYWLVAAGEKHVTRCRQCGELIRLTAHAPGSEGQGKPRKPRQDRRYCDDACRQRYHYQNATKPKREAERSKQR